MDNVGLGRPLHLIQGINRHRRSDGVLLREQLQTVGVPQLPGWLPAMSELHEVHRHGRTGLRVRAPPTHGIILPPIVPEKTPYWT